jgi:hypothetical protein
LSEKISIKCYFSLIFKKANGYRTKKNAIKAVLILWSLVLIANLPQLYLFSSYEYINSNEARAVCILKYNIILSESKHDDISIESAEMKLQLYYAIFILFAYIIPLVSIVIIYTLIIIKLSKSKGFLFSFS